MLASAAGPMSPNTPLKASRFAAEVRFPNEYVVRPALAVQQQIADKGANELDRHRHAVDDAARETFLGELGRRDEDRDREFRSRRGWSRYLAHETTMHRLPIGGRLQSRLR